MRLGIVTYNGMPSLIKSERGLVELFQKKGVEVQVVVWNQQGIDWSIFEVLVFRSIWDYHFHYREFDDWLTQLEAKEIRTLNGIEIVRKNQNKFYLRELRDQGVNIVPTIFIEQTNTLDLNATRDFDWHRWVIKPSISASAYMTEVFSIDQINEIHEKYQSLASDQGLLIQPFMEEVRSFGEISLIFFNRKYSHSVLKTAKSSDFRVQEEYGGTSIKYTPERHIIKAAGSILDHYKGDILYARVDGIVKDDRFMLMELELIEPALFFDLAANSQQRFVDATLELV